MNKYEAHLYRGVIAEQFVRDNIQTGMWCYVADLIDNPEFVPLQLEAFHGMTAAERRSWAKKAARSFRYITLIRRHWGYELMPTNMPPLWKHKHLKKLWRKAYESV